LTQFPSFANGFETASKILEASFTDPSRRFYGGITDVQIFWTFRELCYAKLAMIVVSLFAALPVRSLR